jgi:hypothetical protein
VTYYSLANIRQRIFYSTFKYFILFVRKCKSCNLNEELDSEGRMPPHLFEKYISFFLKDNPFDECPKGGHAAYAQGVTTSSINPALGLSRTAASYFMTYHTILKTSTDYTDAVRQARAIAANITKTLNQGKFFMIRLHIGFLLNYLFN